MQAADYNKIEIRTTSAENELISSRDGFGIQILIDGVVYTDGDDYYVDIDSFFRAFSEPRAELTFVGGCHDLGCCAKGALAELMSDAWIWEPSRTRLNWIDVCRVAIEMIDIIEKHIATGEEVWCAKAERMEFYRKQLEYAEAWAKMS